MTEEKYWIWLQAVLGIGEKTFDILNTFESPKAVYEADAAQLKMSGLFKKTQLERKEKLRLSVANKAISDCRKNGWKIITPDSEYYPELLKEIADFPLVLYVCGDETVLKSKMHIGVIGTRQPSTYGIDVAYTLTRELVRSGAVIVSGGAQGIDSTAHNTAMESGGKTVLIMGCGLGFEYLMQNEPMRRLVSQSGAVISEFPPYAPPTKISFIQRNRITAGMCRGVLVVEAGLKSGTLSTARRSFAYNRDVFVVTGDAVGTNFLGARELVGYGAKVIFSADDILSLYGYEIKNKESFYFGSFGKGVFEGIDDFPLGEKKEKKKKEEKKQEKKQENTAKAKDVAAAKPQNTPDRSLLSPNSAAVLSAIEGGFSRIDDIAANIKLQIRDVLVALTELEMEGFVQCDAGNEYILI